jgi:hypothetical protein
MKRQKRLTKRERKALDPNHRPGPHGHTSHIHCISCGRHIEPAEFQGTPPTATVITCDHGSQFPACVGCMDHAEKLVNEHDKNGQPVKTAPAWH